ncbi:MAG: CYTH domain-containing protein [Bacteroidota bacterium]
MSQEIERKFFLSQAPVFLDQLEFVDIRQGYLAIEDHGTEVRIRHKADQYWLTIKSGGTLARTEVELPVSPEQFAQLWPLTAGRRIEKRRYFRPIQDYTIEIDVFQAPIEGLFLAEIEFPSLAAAEAFVPAPWMGKEVTHHPQFKNKNLFQFPDLHTIASQLS